MMWKDGLIFAARLEDILAKADAVIEVCQNGEILVLQDFEKIRV
ncbi:hypothetical protein [Roseinatronobacter ekhonensis]|nr:hypothetical protein [Roseibaca ekhonensis]